MIYAELLSPWAGTGTPVVDPKRPKFFDDYPMLRADDITGQETAPPPGCLVVGAWMSDDEYVLIEADPTYQVLVSQELPNEEA